MAKSPEQIRTELQVLRSQQGDRAAFGAHNGGHEVHDDTVFPFLHRHLQWRVGPIR